MNSWTLDSLRCLDLKYAEEGIHIHQRPFRAATEILGSSFGIGIGGNLEVKRIMDAYACVQGFFDVVAPPVLEDELGYRLIVIDGRQAYDHARIDQEIFAKPHRSSVVLADITGARPNCFLELG